ncbi:MAG: phage holin family protein [Candidatus Gracilibacteria bacterium]|nr:phage holin family protein [Candidatus Gracilibacteria bacterium]
MQILISVLANAAILFGVAYFLPYDTATGTGVLATGSWQLYIAGGIILGLLNTIVRPILKLLGFPFMILTFGLFILVINGIILKLLEKAIQAIGINGVSYEIHGIAIFAIAVAIFTVFNIVANTLVKK